MSILLKESMHVSQIYPGSPEDRSSSQSEHPCPTRCENQAQCSESSYRTESPGGRVEGEGRSVNNLADLRARCEYHYRLCIVDIVCRESSTVFMGCVQYCRSDHLRFSCNQYNWLVYVEKVGVLLVSGDSMLGLHARSGIGSGNRHIPLSFTELGIYHAPVYHLAAGSLSYVDSCALEETLADV